MDKILEYEKLVYKIIRNFPNFDREDLYQVGILALAKAYKNYKEGFNTKFSTYAYTYILGEVLAYVKECRIVKVNRESLSLYKKINEAKNILEQKLMRGVTNFEVACFLEIDEKIVDDAIVANLSVESLDKPINEYDDNKDVNLYDFRSYEEKMYDADNLDLYMELDNLPPDEREIIYDRYFNDLTQGEISKKLNMSQVQVSRNEAKILKKLKSRLVA